MNSRSIFSLILGLSLGECLFAALTGEISTAKTTGLIVILAAGGLFTAKEPTQ